MFPFLARFCSSQKTGKGLVGRLWFDVTNAMASKRSKKEKIRLPVAVRGSRTSVLKAINKNGKRPRRDLRTDRCPTNMVKMVQSSFHLITLQSKSGLLPFGRSHLYNLDIWEDRIRRKGKPLNVTHGM